MFVEFIQINIDAGEIKISKMDVFVGYCLKPKT